MLSRLWRGRREYDYAPTPRRSNHLPDNPISPMHEKAGIIDDTGITIYDWAYVKQGIREGWLVFDGFHTDGDGDIVWRYCFKGIPDNAV